MAKEELTQMEAIQATWREAHQSRKSVEQLQPLLGLLEQPEPTEGGPIAQILDALEQIILSQKHQMMLLKDLDAKVDALTRSRR